MMPQNHPLDSLKTRNMKIRERLRQISASEAAEIAMRPDAAFVIVFGKELIQPKPLSVKESRRFMAAMKALEQRHKKTGLFERMRQVGGRREYLSQEDLRAYDDYMDEYERQATAALLAQTSYATFGNPDKELDLEDCGHGLHFLLTGTGNINGGDPPTSLAIFGGPAVPQRKALLHLPMIRALSPQQVVEVSQLLSSLSPEALARRYDAAEMRKQHVYVAPEQQANEFQYLTACFDKLRAYYAEAAQNGNSMLFYNRRI